MTARLTRLTKTVMAAICAMVLVAVGTTAAIAATSAESTVTITGTISDPSGYPLAGIKIQMYADGADEGTLVGTTTTNDAGRYRFRGIPAEAGDPFWFGATDTSGAHLYTYAGFEIGSGDATMRNATMKLAGYIQGKVATKDGDAPAQPGRHVYVSAEGEDAAEGVHVSAKGMFRIGALPPGIYTLTFLDPDFADQCYSNIRAPFHESCSGMTQVTVTAGHKTTITPQVMSHPNSTLSGTVTDTNGTPLEGIEVAVYTATNRLINDSTTTADGIWSVDDIDYAGKVRVVARTHEGLPYRTTWYKNAVDFAHATPITVTDGFEIGNLHISMPTQ